MALNLVFIGYSEHLTRMYFRVFIWDNREQIRDWGSYFISVSDQYCPTTVHLLDGTMIRRAPSSLDRLDGLRFDQVIVACDRRGVRHWPEHRQYLLEELIRRASMSDRIREEDRVIYYELDARE